jgi:fructose-1,6-bisphosphatase I
MIGTTITQFLIEEQRNIPGATGDLTSVINDIVTACKAIASAMRYGALSDGDLLAAAPSRNVQGEAQQTLDILANELFLRRTEFGGHVAAMVSEEMEEIYQLADPSPRGRYLLLYDPVDGSSNIDQNAAIGTIFSILRRPDGAAGRPAIDEFLQPGMHQVCAGYAIYGSSCMIVMTTGNGVNGFTLDPIVGEFILTNRDMRIPEDCSRYFMNSSYAPFWDEPIRRYAHDCALGTDGPRQRDFDIRWSACVVADVHRLMIAGGILISAANSKWRREGLPAKLRLLYEVNPLAFIIEQAGGLASAGAGRVLEVMPESLHQRSPIIAGSRNEVNLVLGEYLGEAMLD